MSLFDSKLNFAKSIGYKNIASAISDMSLITFNKAFLRSIDDDTYVHDAVNQQSNNITNVVTCAVMHEINSMYTIYSDGTVRSSYYNNKVIKPHKYKGNANKDYNAHYAVTLTSYTNGLRKVTAYQMSRLMMFYFSTHKYAKIEDMPIIAFITDDTSNWLVSNLRFAQHNEIQLKAVSKRVNNIQGKIHKQHIDIVRQLTKEGMSNTLIGKEFNCSHASVLRFKRRHNMQ